MYYDSSNWSSVNSSGPRPQPNYTPQAERFQYQDPAYARHVVSKYPRMVFESPLLQPPQLGGSNQSRNPWDGKVTDALRNMQYGVNVSKANHYGNSGLTYHRPVGSVMDQAAPRMARPSAENGRIRDMQHVSYSPMYRNSGIHSVGPNLPAQGNYAPPRGTGTSIYAGHVYGGLQAQRSSIISPRGPNFHPRCPTTTSLMPQVQNHPAVPVCSRLASPSFRQSPPINAFPDIKYADTSATFKCNIDFINPSLPAKPQNSHSFDFRASFDKAHPISSACVAAVPRPQIPSNDMYRQNILYNVGREGKSACAPIAASVQPIKPMDIPPQICSKLSSTLSGDNTVPEFGGDFNLDSLLEGPLESGGSFMQQLEDVNSDSFSAVSNQDSTETITHEKSSTPLQACTGYDAYSSSVNAGHVNSNQALAQPTLQGLAHADILNSSNCPDLGASGGRAAPKVLFGNGMMPAAVPRHPSQNIHPFVVPGQQSHGPRDPYRTPECSLQVNTKIVSIPPRQILTAPGCPEPNSLVNVPHALAKTDDLISRCGVTPVGCASAQRPGPVRPSYGNMLRMRTNARQTGENVTNCKGVLTENDLKAFNNDNPVSVHGDQLDGPAKAAVDTADLGKVGNAGDFDVPISSTKKKKIKRPVATLKVKKKKRKKGEDAADFEGNLPPISTVDSAEKRRSSRNVKRKQYVEAYDARLSDEMSESGLEALDAIEQSTLMKADDIPEDLLIVEKILDVRKRKELVKVDGEHYSKDQTRSEPVAKNEIEERADDKIKSKADVDELLVPHGSAHPDPVEMIRQNDEIGDTAVAKAPGTEEKYTEVEEYFLKYKNYSYLHCEWKARDEIQDKRIDGKIKRFKSKLASLPEYMAQVDAEPFNPDFVEVERVLDVTSREEADGHVQKQYFIKWCSLAYEESTWENECDVPDSKIEEFNNRCGYRPQSNPMNMPNKAAWKRLNTEDGIFNGGNQLRDYQLEGINWLLFNWHNRRNCILADEMGLGKTIQSITFLQKVFDYGSGGPFLVVAPLSTICNWQREFMTWTNLNAIVYHGSLTSRDMIKTYEFLCRDENLVEIEGAYKMHVVITTYEMIVLENSHLQDIEWKCLIIDEAHRLKNQTCKLADSLRCMNLKYKVLLTGTPLQNNVEELFALLNFLQPEVFDSSEAFMVEFGDLKENSQVEKLQELLKPMMLRRLKEDVEKSLAPKEETIIEVELTNMQKKYYRAILEHNFEYLSKGSSAGNVPNLMNTMMELRKCCNHPYLIKGAEEKIQKEFSGKEYVPGQHTLQLMVQSSGKLVLIDKLLPRLKSGGHKVLIFSQMVRCLDILEDYLIQMKYSYERIDGGVRGSDRQMAIDRFSKPESEKFVFLLCTRAGGLGINLTAADTVIIFDSDWNPQNDLQAQARCHRIGQTKAVKIYRLITRNSYEREMFDKASLKLGLDKAVLQSMSGRQDEMNQAVAPALSKQEVENLLKRGAYGAIMDEDDDSKKFCEEDIDQILLRRAHTITIAQGEKGSTFSKASFVTGDEHSDILLNDPNFWEKWAKKADFDIDHLKNNKLIIEQPRHRKQTRRFGGMTQDVEVLAEIGSDSDSDYNEKQTSRKQKAKSRTKNWLKKDYFRVEKSLLTFGWGRWSHILANGRFPSYIGETELEKVSRAILMHCLRFYNGDEKIKIFMWDLITPSNHSATAPISNHEGLSAPVARGRRGRQAKDEAKPEDCSISREWVKDVNIGAILHEESFKKHLQHHCNKILLRIRMLCYLQMEILHAGNVEDLDYENIELVFPDIMAESGLAGWDSECDRSLLIGVHKHGYAKYNLIRADPKLCFLKRFGMPDNKCLADDLDYEAEEDNDDPEYKPAKLNFNEYSEFEDSPVSNAPGTAPPSPASSIDSCAANKPSKKISDDALLSQSKDRIDEVSEAKKEEPKGQNVWPTTAELNMRLRRIVMSYQKQHKQIRYRMMNMDRGSPSPKAKESREKMHWTRREEADFYRTVSTFGVEYDEHDNLTWTKFRSIAKLEKKSNTSLDLYYLSFKSMCEQVCGNKTPHRSSTAIAKVTEERASRTLYRIELLNRIRLDVLRHKDLDARLELCERSPELPVWWKPGDHDKELLSGMDKHGVTRTEVHILTDPSLSFFKTMRDYENKHPQKATRKRKLETSDSLDSADKKKKVESPCGVPDADVITDEGSCGETESSKVQSEASNTITVQETKAEDANLFLPFSSQKWPKDRILIQRVEHVCYCVIHGRWPVAHVGDSFNTMDVSSARKYVSSQVLPVTKPDPKSTNERKLQLDDLEKHLRKSHISQVLEYEMKKNHHKRGGSLFTSNSHAPAYLVPVSQRNLEGKLVEMKEQKPEPKSDLLNMSLYNSQISETLQYLLKTDTSDPVADLKMTAAEKAVINKAMKSFNLNMKFPQKKMPISQFEEVDKNSPVEEEVPSNPEKIDLQGSLLQVAKKKKPDKILKKKIMQKPKTGFISPAVLPSDARIPVYNPSEKKKLTGDDAPLNKDLADWLKEHPGYVVDYKNLRQKLCKADREGREATKPAPSNACSKSPKPTISVAKEKIDRSRAEDSAISSASDDEKRNLQANEQLLQQQSSLNAALMNSFFGTTPEMATLLSSGFLPSMVLPVTDQSKNRHRPKKLNHAKQEQQKTSEEKEAAALAAAVFGYPFTADSVSADPRKIKSAYPHLPSHFDEKLLAANAHDLSTFFGGMPGAVNPLFYSIYANPDLLAQYPFQHPLLMTSFNEKDFAKQKLEESSASLSELFGVPHHQIPKPGLDLNDTNLQKFMQAQASQSMLDPYMMSALGAMSSKSATDFDNMFRSIYQQLNSVPAQIPSNNRRKEERTEKPGVKKKSRESKEEEPMDLTSNFCKK